MSEFIPEGRATKWSLLAAYNTTSELVDYLHMEDTWNALHVANYVWDTTTLGWVKEVQTALITDSLYLAVDDLEALVNSTNTDYLLYIKQSLQVMDDWDESDRAKVNLIPGVAGITGGSGAIAAGTPRVTLATNDPAVAHLATIAAKDSTFSVTIIADSVGLATEATLSSIKTAVEIIDNAISGNEMQVDIVSSALPAGAATEATLGSILADTASIDTSMLTAVILLGTIDTDTGNIATSAAAAAASLAIMDDWDLNDRCRVSPISGQDGVAAGEGTISALTQRVTIATDDDMVASVASLLQEVQDHKQDYFLGGWIKDGVNVYVGKVDKAGNYIIIKHATDTGVVTYEGGSGGLPANSGWAALSYQAYNVEF